MDLVRLGCSRDQTYPLRQSTPSLDRGSLNRSSHYEGLSRPTGPRGVSNEAFEQEASPSRGGCRGRTGSWIASVDSSRRWSRGCRLRRHPDGPMRIPARQVRAPVLRYRRRRGAHLWVHEGTNPRIVGHGECKECKACEACEACKAESHAGQDHAEGDSHDHGEPAPKRWAGVEESAPHAPVGGRVMAVEMCAWMQACRDWPPAGGGRHYCCRLSPRSALPRLTQPECSVFCPVCRSPIAQSVERAAVNR